MPSLPGVTFRRSIRTYAVDSAGLVLYDEADGRLFSLNASAAFVWRLFEQGASASETIAELADAASISAARARSDVESLLDDWRRCGWVLAQDDPLPVAASDEEALESAESAESPGPSAHRGERACEAVGRAERGSRRVLGLLDSALILRCDDDLASTVDSLFGDAVVPDSVELADCTEAAIHFDGEAWIACVDGSVVGRCSQRTEVASLVYGLVLTLTHALSDCFAALHAAAVARGGQCVVMPAASGSGKSTLTAALVAAGYEYCTDDLALLFAPPIRLRPVPSLIGIKSGSWPALESFWPELAAIPEHGRADGKRLKYLPLGGKRSTAKSLEIAALVFPKFEAGTAASLSEIARSDALLRMTEAGYDQSQTLSRGSVETLVEWLRETPCYELRFDDLGEALAEFDAVLP